jgi:hypothetical protein
MSVRVVVQNSLPASASPYRLLDDRGHQLTWVNQFLDAQKLRQLSLRSLRAYAFDLLHLARWLKAMRHCLNRLNQRKRSSKRSSNRTCSSRQNPC